MIFLTVIFDCMLVYLPFNFAKHVVTGTILTDLFGVMSTMDKAPSEVLFEAGLYFAAACIIELIVISNIEILRCLAFSPSSFKPDKKYSQVSHVSRFSKIIVITTAFSVIVVLNVLIYIYL